MTDERDSDMTVLQHDVPFGTVDSPAVRGLLHLPPEMHWQLLVHLVSAIDRGRDRHAAAFVNAVRRYEHGKPVRDATGGTVYSWDEWLAEFGGGVSASDEPGGRAQ
jgi:hypothetical protein